jgi:1-acyl-sn-glycerol-3-phosphate acyltransferase
MALRAGVVPLTQLRVRLGFASPTLRNPLPQWAPSGGEERVRGLLAQRGQFHPEGSAARPVRRKKQGGSPMALRAGVVPLTQLRVRLGFASPTLRNPLPQWAPSGGEERVRGLLAQRGQFHPEGSAARPVRRKKQGGSPMPLRAGVVPLTQLRVRLGFASPTLRNPLPPVGERKG